MNALIALSLCLCTLFAIAMNYYERERNRNHKLSNLISKCPLLHTTTCNNAELTWIKEAKTIIKEN